MEEAPTWGQKGQSRANSLMVIWVVARDNLVPSEHSLCPIATDRPSTQAV